MLRAADAAAAAAAQQRERRPRFQLATAGFEPWSLDLKTSTIPLYYTAWHTPSIPQTDIYTALFAGYYSRSRRETQRHGLLSATTERNPEPRAATEAHHDKSRHMSHPESPRVTASHPKSPRVTRSHPSHRQSQLSVVQLILEHPPSRAIRRQGCSTRALGQTRRWKNRRIAHCLFWNRLPL